MRDQFGSYLLSRGTRAAARPSTRHVPIFASAIRNTTHRLEALEPRVLLSTTFAQDNTLNQLNSASVTISVSSTWFQDLAPGVNSSDGGVAIQVIDGHASSDTSIDPASQTGVIHNEWLIQLTDNAILAAGSVAGAGDILGLPGIGVQVVRGLGQAGLVLVDDASITSGVNLVDYLQGNDDVAYIASNYQFNPSFLPDDSYFRSLWGLNNTGQFTGSTSDADIDAPEAWTMATDLNSVVVAVVDTGVDYTHPDLADHIWTNPGEIPGNGIDDDGNGFVDDVHGYDFANNDADPMDDYGHGTHVAGTIAAAANNSMGVAGVAPNARIMALKFITSAGTGSTANAIRALNYATMMSEEFGVNVVATNNSWGGSGYSVGLYNAIRASGNAGIIFVASAGNDAQNIDVNPEYPASYDLDNIITVAASTWDDQLASFSNYGSTDVDIAAPGQYIRSTLPGNTYGYYSGTSMAAPHVAGAVALYMGEHPDASITEVKNAIIQGGDSLDSMAGITASGKRLNLVGMLQQTLNGDTPNPPSPTPVHPTPPPVAIAAADISLDIINDSLDGQILPGQRDRVQIALTNVGELDARGKAELSFYLSTDNTLDEADVLVYQKSNYNINLRTGHSKTAWFRLAIPDDLPRGDYHLIAVAMTDSAVGETNTDNNIIVSSQLHELVWQVGDVQGQRNTSLTLPDDQGNLIRFTLNGAGTATISGDGSAQSIILTGTDPSTRLTLQGKTRGQISNIGEILVSGSMGSLTAKNVTLNGDLTIQGDIRSLKLGDVNAVDIQLGQTNRTSIHLGNVTDTSIASEGNIRYLRAVNWLDTDAKADSISASSIKQLRIRGDMAADVTTSDADASTFSANISGALESAHWQIAGDVGSLRASGSITDFTLIVSGEIRSISTGRDGRLSATLQAQSFGKILAGGELTGSITALDADTRGRSIRQVRASSIQDLSLDTPGDVSSIRSRNNITQLTAHIAGNLSTFRGNDLQDVHVAVDGSLRSVSVQSWDQGQLMAGSATTLNVRNNLNDVTISLTDTPDPDAVRLAPVLKTLRISGTAQGLDLSAAGDIRTMTMGAMTHSYVHVGVTSGTASVLDPVTFGDTGSIRTFTVRGLRGVDEASFDSSVIQVRQIGRVTLQEVVEVDTAGAYGVVTQSMDRFTRRTADNQRIRLDALQNMITADRVGSFVLRIV